MGSLSSSNLAVNSSSVTNGFAVGVINSQLYLEGGAVSEKGVSGAWPGDYHSHIPFCNFRR
jgi:hypothetical protein